MILFISIIIFFNIIFLYLSLILYFYIIFLILYLIISAIITKLLDTFIYLVYLFSRFHINTIYIKQSF